MSNLDLFTKYASSLNGLLKNFDWKAAYRLAEALHSAWENGSTVFLCGNGASAANAVHLANDLIYGISPGTENGIKAHVLSCNCSVITCLANDIAYDKIFSYQVSVLGNQGDLLIAFSGSGNSPNVINALIKAKEMNVKTAALLGFSGGRALELADIAVHFPVDNMQISEDCQQIIGHMLMCWLKENPVASDGKNT
jgi:D-sedoheptulose 7-phosphate isomerase